jgi:hypothetical protein
MKDVAVFSSLVATALLNPALLNKAQEMLPHASPCQHRLSAGDRRLRNLRSEAAFQGETSPTAVSSYAKPHSSKLVCTRCAREVECAQFPRENRDLQIE